MRCGRMQQDETEFRFASVVRKQLGLTFSGETRDNFHITGDIRLEGVGLTVRPVSTFSKERPI
jgi:hypothetical protein